MGAKGASFRLSKKKIRLSRKGKLTLKLPTRGARRVTATLGGGSIRASNALRRKLRRHKTVKLGVRVRTVDTQGRVSSFRISFRGRR